MIRINGRRMSRCLIALAALACVSAGTADAQRWGGGGPGVSPQPPRGTAAGQPAAGMPVVVRLIVQPLIVESVAAQPLEITALELQHRRAHAVPAVGYGANASRPQQWGGSPATRLRSTRARDVVPGVRFVTPRADAPPTTVPVLTEPMRTRDAYRARRGIP